VCVLALSSLQFGPIANFAVTPKRDSPLAPICVDQLFKFRAIQFVSPYFSGPNCCNYHLAFWLRIAALMRRLGRHCNALNPLNHRGQNALAYATKFKVTRPQMQAVCMCVRVCACTSLSAAPLRETLRREKQKEGAKGKINDISRENIFKILSSLKMYI